MMFKFENRQKVEIVVSGEFGEIIGRAEYPVQEDKYLIRYKNANGVATENWWSESAIEITS
jgi:hypothetical protein